MEANYSEIEKKIIKEQERALKLKKKNGSHNFAWWKYDDSNQFFTVCTKKRYSYKTG
jgi:hypothetical protein